LLIICCCHLQLHNLLSKEECEHLKSLGVMTGMEKARRALCICLSASCEQSASEPWDDQSHAIATIQRRWRLETVVPDVVRAVSAWVKQALIIPYGGKELVESTVRRLDFTMREPVAMPHTRAQPAYDICSIVSMLTAVCVCVARTRTCVRACASVLPAVSGRPAQTQPPGWNSSRTMSWRV
jgi:hypothetical protein